MSDFNTGNLIKMKKFEMESRENYKKGWSAYMEHGLAGQKKGDNPYFNLGFAKAQEYYSKSKTVH